MPLYHVLSPSKYTLAPSPRGMISTVKRKNCGKLWQLCALSTRVRQSYDHLHRRNRMKEQNWRIEWRMKNRMNKWKKWIERTKNWWHKSFLTTSRVLTFACFSASLSASPISNSCFLLVSFDLDSIISCPEPALLSLSFQRCRNRDAILISFSAPTSPCLQPIQRCRRARFNLIFCRFCPLPSSGAQTIAV